MIPKIPINAYAHRKFKTPEELADAINRYIESCWEEVWIVTKDGNKIPMVDENGNIRKKQVRPYTMSGFLAFIGSHRKLIHDYKNRPGFADVIEAFRNICENNLEEKSLLGDYNATMAIFSLKNHFGWTDKQEIEHSGEVNIDFDTKTLEQLLEEAEALGINIKKYIDVLQESESADNEDKK